jgi:UbiD family decarboxylase
MAVGDLREFIRRLEDAGELLRIRKEISADLELSAVIRCAGEQGVLCERVRGFDVPIAANLFGNHRSVAVALEAAPERAVWEFIRRIEQRVEPVIVPEGPVQQVVLRGEDVDLTRLPVPWVHEADGGRFICAGLVIARDPDYGMNVSIQRLQIKGPAKTGIFFPWHQHLAMYYRRAEARGEGLPIAVVIGCDPALYLASQMRGEPRLDEYAVAGALREAPLGLVRCQTVDLAVPAEAEIVLEGVIPPGIREEEGPFGEFPGYYTGSPESRWPIVQYTALTRRADPIYQTIYLGKPPTENNFLTSLPKAASLYRTIETVASDVRDIYFTPGGCGTYHVVISLNKQYATEGRLVLNAALSARQSIKQVIVVDDDIDIRNPHDVEWAVATRAQFDVDGIVLADAPMSLDPSTHAKRGSELGVRVGIDATRPFGKPFPAPTAVSAQLLDEVRRSWAEYVGAPARVGVER